MLSILRNRGFILGFFFVFALSSTPAHSHTQILSCALAFANDLVLPTVRAHLFNWRQNRLVDFVFPVSHTVVQGWPMGWISLPSDEALVTTAPRTRLSIQSAVAAANGQFHYALNVSQYQSGYLLTPELNDDYGTNIYDYKNVGMLNMIDLAQKFPTWSRHFGYEFKDNRLFFTSVKRVKSLSEAIGQTVIADLMLPKDLPQNSESLRLAFVQTFDFALHATSINNSAQQLDAVRKMYKLFRAMGGEALEFLVVVEPFGLVDAARIALVTAD